MWKTASALAAGTLLTMLTGCSGGQPSTVESPGVGPTTSISSTEPSPEPTQTGLTVDQIRAAALAISDEQGEKLCELFRGQSELPVGGATLYSYTANVEIEGFTREEIQQIYGDAMILSTYLYCPDQTDRVRAAMPQGFEPS